MPRVERLAGDMLTAADFRALPPGPPYAQLIDGELITAPAPNIQHQIIAGNVFRILDGYARSSALGKVFFAPVDVYLSEHDVVQPDVFFISSERHSRLVDEGVHGAPDLVVEIISPSSGQLEKRRKRPLYARSGVREEWLIDPHLEQIHRYDFATDAVKPVRIVDTDESFETPVFPGLVIHGAEVFRA
jgi:Uma2 family endonuclease